MSDNSRIEWCDATWQVTAGCTKIATGCKNCFAIRDAHRLAGNPNPKISEPRKGTTHRVGDMLNWTGLVRTLPQNLDWPLRKKKPLKIFVDSNSDLFHDAIPFEFIAACYGVMAACPQHLFIILTKRPKRMREFMAWHADEDHGIEAFDVIAGMAPSKQRRAIAASTPPALPLPNVIHGYSAATQPDLEAGINDLLQTPSAIRCLSLEPLIGPIELGDVRPERALNENQPTDVIDALEGWLHTPEDSWPHPKLDWIIVGGESGPGARDFEWEWWRSIHDQCKAADVPAFLKQGGGNPTVNYYDEEWRAFYDQQGWDWPDPAGWNECDGQPHADARVRLSLGGKGGDMSRWPEQDRVRQFPTLQPEVSDV